MGFFKSKFGNIFTKKVTKRNDTLLGNISVT